MKLLLPILLITALASSGQSPDTIQVIDLGNDWKVYEDQIMVPYAKKKYPTPKVIYLEVDPGRYSKENSRLRIQSLNRFSLYLNYRLLVFNSTQVELHLDSLQNQISTPWLFSLHQPDGLSWLKTDVVLAAVMVSDNYNTVRSENYYLDFSIIASLSLIIFFISLLQTNPRLTFDYFNFVRLFSIQEREDSLLNSRISSSVNILYYGFSSISLGFVLLTIFHFGADHIGIAESFQIRSLSSALFQWLKLSLLVFGALVVRLIILSAFGSLFNFRDVISLQFYNSVRLGFFISTASCLVCLSYFVIRVQTPQPYSFLLGGIVTLLVFWVFMIGLKLLRRTSLRFFHLFSYLCASELIPIVILVKVLNS